MQTKTFTALITITDDGIAAAFNPAILAAALQGALETGIKSFMLDSAAAAIVGAQPCEHFLNPVASATVDAFPGDRLASDFFSPVGNDIRSAQRRHTDLRGGR